ncbi:MAG TPA: type VI immunity family protein [Archangium sp.]|uniref:type VI immunity family protein n=1 Tax=Archangium sp. TaxID=1872627 RepID=UPI002E2F426E|nr:type VI immunity family protein [Archangium sp.]HEX5751735.1 type VI immunity family protein [Archangium sp.]
MNEHYPRIRRYGPTRQGERLLIREVVQFTFYLPHDHHDLAVGVARALDAYQRAVGVGPEAISYWEDTSSETSHSIVEKGWQAIHECLHPGTRRIFLDDFGEETEFFRRNTKQGYEVFFNLTGAPSFEYNGYGFTYCARLPWRSPPEGSVSVLRATLPTEYLEQHGPGRVRELVLEMASSLRFSTGHAGLAFELLGSRRRLLPEIRTELFRYPGVDASHVGVLLCRQGTHVEGVHWLNFLGQPVLGALEGVAGLRTRLHSPGTTVQEMEGERALVTLGQWPEAGDMEQGRDLPAYRELARVLEPWSVPFSPGFVNSWRGYTEEEVRRWWRRFLD